MNMQPRQKQTMSRRMVIGVAAGSILALTVLFFFVFNVGNVRSVFASSTTYYARTNGNWENNATWSTSSASGAAASSYPKAGDIVDISGHTITIANANEACASVTGVGDGSILNVSNGKQLTTTGDITLSASSGNGSMGFTVSGTGSMLTIGGNLTINKAGGTTDINIAVSGTSSVSVGGNSGFNITGGGSDITVTLSNSAVFNITNGSLALATGNTSGKVYVNLKDHAQLNAVNLTYDCIKAGAADVTMSNTSTINLTGNIIRQDTDAKNGILSSGDSSQVNFKGNVQQVITAGATGGDTLYMHDFTVNNSSSTSPQVVLNSNVYVSGTLTLTKGIVQTSASHMIILSDGAVSSGGSSTCYVSGPMRKDGTSAFVFPVGKGGIYAPIAISAPSTSSSFVAEYFNTAYTNTTSIDNTLGNVSKIEYWDLHRASGSGSAKITLYWNSATRSNISNASDLKVAHYDATAGKWSSIGNTAYTSANGAGTVTSNTNSNFSPFTFGSSGINALPVTLSSFNVLVHGSSVIANWATASEINNDYFTLERSENGTDFAEVGKVNGHGTTESRNDYEYEDKAPMAGTSYYRLKQTDFNGKTSYSQEKVVNITRATINSVNPNPFREHFTVEYTMPEGGDANIQLMNIQGKVVYEENVPSQKGQNVYNFNNNRDLNPGTYILRLVSNGEVVTYKLVKSN